MKSVATGVGAGMLMTLLAVACMRPQPSHQPAEWEKRQQKMNVITNLWTQIRGWRREAGLGLDPMPATLNQIQNQTVKEAERVCAEGHAEPKQCADVCSLATAICDNAETICSIADELGKDDAFAQEKCSSAKASCKEAKQRCCNCSEEPQP